MVVSDTDLSHSTGRRRDKFKRRTHSHQRHWTPIFSDEIREIDPNFAREYVEVSRGPKQLVPTLFKSIRKGTVDRILEHTLIYSLGPHQ